MILEDHAELKDKCQMLCTKANELANDMKEIEDIDMKIYSLFYEIDAEITSIYEWYEKYRKLFKRYSKDKDRIIEKIQTLDDYLKYVNNEVQNLKLREFSRAQQQ